MHPAKNDADSEHQDGGKHCKRAPYVTRRNAKPIQQLMPALVGHGGWKPDSHVFQPSQPFIRVATDDRSSAKQYGDESHTQNQKRDISPGHGF